MQLRPALGRRGPFGVLRAVDHLVARDGKVVSATLVFGIRALAVE